MVGGVVAVVIYGEKICNYAASHHVKTQRNIRQQTNALKFRASARLAGARASTDHEKIYGPSHLTKVSADHSEVDGYVYLTAPNAMAIEFGHFPSGYFAPEKFGRMTKAPHGLYILTGAAFIGGQTSISSGRSRGKR